MGSCFSKRKFLSDAAVTHNASPRTSCASKEFTEQQGFTFGTNKEGDGATDFPGTKTLNKKKKSKPARSFSDPEQQYIEPALEDRRSFAPSPPSLPSSAAVSLRDNSSDVVAMGEGTGGVALRSVEELRLSPLPPPGTTKDVPVESAPAFRASSEPAITDTPVDMKQPALRQSRSTNDSQSQVFSCAHLVMDGELPRQATVMMQATMVIGNGVEDETNTKPVSTNSKLKRSRSYEQSMRMDDAKRPLRSIFQREEEEDEDEEDGADIEEKAAPRRFSDGVVPPCQFATHSGGRANGVKCSKFLEGLDLIDLHPSKPATNLIDQAHYQGFAALQFSSSISSDGCHAEDHARISADFLELKHRYLSSRTKPAPSSCPQVDDDRSVVAVENDGRMRGNALHTRSCSMDSSAERGFYSFQRNQQLRIGAVAEEEGCELDDSDDETFEFKQAVSLFSRENMPIYEQKQQQMRLQQQELHRQPIAEEEEEGQEEEEGGRYEGVSVVSTGDAVLVSGSKSRELHLIPSKAYFHEGSSSSSRSMEATNAGAQAASASSSAGQQQLSVEEIIKLLEGDELDEEVLVSLFSVSMGGGRNYSSSSNSNSNNGGGGGTTPASADGMSEASFEFKLVSTGSTPPHSTPSTPMLSAGSTPTRRQVTQLSPLALTPEEIAEIWGVFEQRQSLVT